MKKQFVIIGCGRFGSSVAKTLYSMGHEVLVIDRNEEIIQAVAEQVTHAVQADATDENSIKSLGIRNFDVAVVTIGSNIQSSILVTLMIKELGVEYVVAKAQNELHAKVLYKIGADRVVFPEREMGVRVAHNLVSSNIMDYIELAPDYSIVEIATLHEWIGKSLRELDMRSRYGINVMAIKRGPNIDISPMATDSIEEGDVLVVIGHNDDIQKIERR
ncbi:potassium channel family protein [Paramaledivibacter caminithermalis]|jgi:trk system potassium uptake protein TrkA|uniref:Trk system potassium uptake protein TrkA n=1 Tax=Paramaledivibacter caminithermalis (strain DSM 15212 / CIP 107654 / DViRD3) TaxID=1121301 RepID=A0A1M6PY64_PARC5|nr:TrkA family potassium uptake protein [Paramaledivibacter caminithermalis]SHK12889.1 trk system potassium uptake protein TrkA [Paramaledivibacter caminithermalis DSM 15212]